MLGIKGDRSLVAYHSIHKHIFYSSKTSKFEVSWTFRVDQYRFYYSSSFKNLQWVGAAIISSVDTAETVDTADMVAMVAMVEAMAMVEAFQVASEAMEMEATEEAMEEATEVAMDIPAVDTVVVDMVADTVVTDGNSNGSPTDLCN